MLRGIIKTSDEICRKNMFPGCMFGGVGGRRMDIAKLLQFLSDNGATAEHTDFVQSLAEDKPVTELEVRRYLESDEGFKTVLEPKLHSHFDKTLVGWKEKNLPTIVAEEIKKGEEPENKALIEIRELKEQLAKSDSEKAMITRKAELVKEHGANIDPFFIDFLINEDEETTKTNIEKAQSLFSSAVKTQLETHIKNNGRHVEKGSEGGGEGTPQDFNKMFLDNNITNK